MNESTRAMQTKGQGWMRSILYFDPGFRVDFCDHPVMFPAMNQEPVGEPI